MPIVHLKEAQLEALIPKNDLIIFDFWAHWCTPHATLFENLAQKFSEVTFCKVNIEEEERLAELFQVRSIPTIAFMREGIIVFSHAGTLAEEALIEGITNLQQLNMAQVHQDLLEAQNSNTSTPLNP